MGPGVITLGSGIEDESISCAKLPEQTHASITKTTLIRATTLKDASDFNIGFS
jgi:hypothetical protein